MPTVEFAPALTRHVACAPQQVAGDSLAAALDAALGAAPGLRAYVLDEQGVLRKHVAVFVNARLVPRREGLALGLARDDRVLVIQALTGG